MSRTALLVCSHAIETDALAAATVVEDLCRRPAAAAAALRAAGADTVVLGLCERRPSAELVAALRRAGAVPFGIETVELGDPPSADAALLVSAARAKLGALPPDERGRASFNAGAISRRTLFSLGGALTHRPVAALDEPACAGTARCSLCVERCPQDAIAGTAPVPTVDPGACTGCGICMPHCPSGALRLTGTSPAQTEAQLDRLVPGTDGIVFACAAADAEPVSEGWALVELPTLSLLSVGWILQVRARGAQVRLAPCGTACCAGVPAVEALAVQLPVAGPPAGHIHLAEPAATVEALDQAGVRIVESDASPLGLVAVSSDRCTLCGACSAACPTGALELDETAAGTTLRFHAATCVACNRCAAACPEAAVTVRRAVDVARVNHGPEAVATAARERCRACGADLPPLTMRRRLRQLLPQLAGAPPDLCAGCAAGAAA